MHYKKQMMLCLIGDSIFSVVWAMQVVGFSGVQIALSCVILLVIMV